MAPTVQQLHVLAKAAAEAFRWSEAYQLLQQADSERLTPRDLALFADAAWWCCRVDEEIVLRRRAFAGFTAAGRPEQAAYAAWLLSVRHALRGQAPAASGWLKRAQHQLAGLPECVEHGYLACGEAEQALSDGRPTDAEEQAARAAAIGRRFGDADLVAIGLCWRGLCRLNQGDFEGGSGFLDEAMTSVATGELNPLFTGWVYCFAIGICMGVADLDRAGSWTRQAWEWASSLPEPTPYRGLCRVRQIEIMSLRGELKAAGAEAHRACEEMLAFEPNLAGEAFYVAGEILRRRGDLPAAEEAYREARELGHDPQPGLALLRLAQGRGGAASAALRAADQQQPPFRRVALLAAEVEVALAECDLGRARTACRTLEEVVGVVPSDALRATAATCRGRIFLAESAAKAALDELRPALKTWRTLDLACEAAETRALIGMAMHRLGDREGAELELRSAQQSFERLGAVADAQRIQGLLTAPNPTPGRLTDRECEVLRLVATGSTNRQIATALAVSEHTVARHLSNIFTKLDVTTRTAAAAFAHEHSLT